MEIKRIIIKQSIDIVVSYLRELYKISDDSLHGSFGQWVSYFLESIEADIGPGALETIKKIIDKRFTSGRW